MAIEGQHENHVVGKVADPLTLDIQPGHAHGLIELCRIKVICSIEANGELSGRWQPNIGTEGILTATRLEKRKL